jgi:hypothetical protein
MFYRAENLKCCGIAGKGEQKYVFKLDLYTLSKDLNPLKTHSAI